MTKNPILSWQYWLNGKLHVKKKKRKKKCERARYFHFVFCFYIQTDGKNVLSLCFYFLSSSWNLHLTWSKNICEWSVCLYVFMYLCMRVLIYQCVPVNFIFRSANRQIEVPPWQYIYIRLIKTGRCNYRQDLSKLFISQK